MPRDPFIQAGSEQTLRTSEGPQRAKSPKTDPLKAP